MERDIPTSSPAQAEVEAAANGTNGTNGAHGAMVLRSAMLPSESGTSGDSGSVNPRAVLSALRRRWFLAVSIGTVLGAVAAAAAWKLIPAPYTAYSEIYIRQVDPKILTSVDDNTARFETYKQSMMYRVRSPMVLVAALRDPNVARTSIIRAQDEPDEYLKGALKVTSPGIEYIRIALSGEHPKELQTIVNAVKEAYFEEVVSKEKDALHERRQELDKVYQRVGEKLRQTRRAMKELASSIEAGTDKQRDQKHQALMEMHVQLRKEYAQVSMDLLHAEIELAARKKSVENLDDLDIPDEVLDEQMKQHPDYLIADNRVESYKSRVEKAQRTLDDMHPTLVQLRKNLATAEETLKELQTSLKPRIAKDLLTGLTSNTKLSMAELEDTVRHLNNLKSTLDDELDKVKTQEKATGLYSAQIEELALEASKNETLSQQLSQKIEQIKIELQARPRIERYIDAESPAVRDTKKKIFGTAAAGFGVFGGFVLLVVLLEYRSTRISSLDEVIDGLGMRVIGAVPHMPRAATGSRNGRKRGKAAFWHSVLTESIDSTRTILLREAKIESLQTIMIASAMGGEGKSTLSCHLATSLARAGRKVAVLDCDMRRPSVNRVFDLPLGPGICEILRGEAELEECLHDVAPEGLSVLTAGKIDQSILRILAEGGASELFEQLKAMFDFIIIDSAPLLPVTDSLLVAQHADGVLFSIRRDVSRASKVAAAHQRLGMLGVPLLGAVVIGLSSDNYGYRYPYRRQYGYGGYGYGNQNLHGYGYNVQPPA
jgi:capsular exopolysaccharide synthesis family protein